MQAHNILRHNQFLDLGYLYRLTLRCFNLQMSTRLAYQQCVDECASIQDIITSILSIKDEPTSLVEKRKRFDTLQSDARKRLSALKSFIGKLDQMLNLTATPENRKKLEAIENQYASFLVSGVHSLQHFIGGLPLFGSGGSSVFSLRDHFKQSTSNQDELLLSLSLR